MDKKFDFVAFFVAFVVGSIVVIGFSWLMGSMYDSPLYPLVSLISGFIVSGFLVGILSKGVTIVEPGLASILVAGTAYFALTSLELPGFMGVNDSDWIIVLLNSIIVTFVGAWVGEMIQHGGLKLDLDNEKIIEWSWVLVGSVIGIFTTLILVNIFVIIFGPSPEKFYIPFFLAMLLAGYINALKSEGKTIKEAAIAGFIAFTILIDIVRITLFTYDEIPIEFILGGLVAGTIFSFIGGFVGEEVQAINIKKLTK